MSDRQSSTESKTYRVVQVQCLKCECFLEMRTYYHNWLITLYSSAFDQLDTCMHSSLLKQLSNFNQALMDIM